MTFAPLSQIIWPLVSHRRYYTYIDNIQFYTRDSFDRNISNIRKQDRFTHKTDTAITTKHATLKKKKKPGTKLFPKRITRNSYTKRIEHLLLVSRKSLPFTRPCLMIPFSLNAARFFLFFLLNHSGFPHFFQLQFFLNASGSSREGYIRKEIFSGALFTVFFRDFFGANTKIMSKHTVYKILWTWWKRLTNIGNCGRALVSASPFFSPRIFFGFFSVRLFGVLFWCQGCVIHCRTVVMYRSDRWIIFDRIINDGFYAKSNINNMNQMMLVYDFKY